jgi:signal transduction histidine kinase/CheY-like chemotaxis protein
MAAESFKVQPKPKPKPKPTKLKVLNVDGLKVLEGGIQAETIGSEALSRGPPTSLPLNSLTSTPNARKPWHFFLLGVGLGVLFPITGAILSSFDGELGFSSSFWVQFWDNFFFNVHPLMRIIHLAPFILGPLAWLLGRQQLRLQEFNSKLELEVGIKTEQLSRQLEIAQSDTVRWKTFIDVLPYGAVFVNNNSIYLNRRAQGILGYHPNEIRTIHDWFTILHPKDWELQLAAYQQDRLKAFPTSTLVPIQQKSKGTVFLEITRKIEEQGEFWLLSDHTSQLELQNERNIKNELLEKTSDGILILDQNFKILSQNAACEQRSGPLRNEDFKLLIPDGKRDPFAQQVVRELQEIRFWHGQIQLLDHNQEEYPALLRLFAHFDPILQKPFYSALITDLSELELERYKSIQTAKLASIGELAAGVGHEINNPLAILQGIYDSVVRLVDKQAPYERIKHQLEKQESALNRITKIVDALRLYARGEKVPFEPVSIHQGIRDTLSLVEAMFAKCDITVISELNAQNDVIMGNLGQIQQVIMNLLSNARDAMEESMIKRITITSSNEGPYFKLSVTDTGAGMDDKTKQKMFQPFFTTKTRGKGTGLGTSISLGIIRNHHGQFDFTSKLNEGTTFWFKIKTAKSLEAESATQTKSLEGVTMNITNRPKNRVCALVVDDEPEIRDILRFILERKNIEVCEAEDGLEALTKYKSCPVDVIICDIQMPNLDGVGLLTELRKDANFHSKFILITGGIQINRTTKGHKDLLDSIDGFLRKPFNEEELTEMLIDIKLISPPTAA